MAERYLCEYTDLEGVEGNLKGPMSKSPRGAVDTLSKHRATSAAADYGAIMVWIDDAGQYRAALCRHFVKHAATVSKTKVGLIKWLRAWWPAMRDPHFTPEAAHG